MLESLRPIRSATGYEDRHRQFEAPDDPINANQRSRRLINCAEGRIGALLAVIALALTSSATPATAQVGTPTTVSDSLVSYSFLPEVLKTLADQFARAARDTARRTVWDIHLPEENREAWIPLRDFVLRATNGRLATAADSGVFTLSLRSFVMRGELLELDFNLGSVWRCSNGEAGGSGTMYAIRMQPPDPRFGGYRRVSDPVETGNYDSIGCGVGGDER